MTENTSDRQFMVVTEIKGVMTERQAREECQRCAATMHGNSPMYVVRVIAAYQKNPGTASEISCRFTGSIKQES